MYLAQDSATGGLVALKHCRSPEEAVKELAAASQVKSSAFVIPMRQASASDPSWLSMPFSIMNLRLFLEEWQGKIIPQTQVLSLLLSLLCGLQSFAKANLCHRDLKPENLLLFPGDHLRVIDFGAARLVPPADYMKTLIGSEVRFDQTASSLIETHSCFLSLTWLRRQCSVKQLVLWISGRLVAFSVT